ncbi:MAG: hypothetical protein ABWY08_06085 [Comamonas sp.]
MNICFPLLQQFIAACKGLLSGAASMTPSQSFLRRYHLHSMKMVLLGNMLFASFAAAAFLAAEPIAAFAHQPEVKNPVNRAASSFSTYQPLLAPAVNPPNTHILSAICQLR